MAIIKTKNDMNMKLSDSMKGKLLLIILCTLFSINVSALTFEVNGVYYTAISETEVKVVHNPVTGYSGDIVIAEEVTHDDMTFAVTAIAEGAFYSDSLMTSVTIPKSVTNIHEWAFENCYGLQSVIVAADNPNYCSVNGALYNKAKTELRYCPGATTGRFDVEEGVTDILAPAFIDCRNVTIIGIPASTTYIQLAFTRYFHFNGELMSQGGSSFNYPTLQEFDISPENQSYHFENGVLYDKGVTSILKVLASVPETVELPEGITIVSDDAFRRKFSLKKIVFPSSLTRIGNGAFYQCTNLKTASFEKCDKLEYIDDFAFNRCTSLENVSFEKCAKLEYIGGYAFEGAPINSVTIPATVKTIGEHVFNCIKELVLSEGPTKFDFNCISVTGSEIESIHLPSTLKNIILPTSALPNLKTLTIESGGNYKTVNNVLFNLDMTHLYMCASKGVIGEYTIPFSVTTISDYAFNANSTITKLTIPGSIKTIPYRMFSGSITLKTLVMEEGVEEIKDAAFYGNALKYLYIPSSLKKIESYWSFFSTSVILEVYSFSDVELSNVIICHILHTNDEPSSVKQTADGFLYYLDSDTPVLAGYEGDAKEVVMPETIEGKDYIIGQGCFIGNQKIESLTLPNTKSLADFPGQYTFDKCYNTLKKVVIPAGTTSGNINENIFCCVHPEIIISPENKNLVYENNILYNADKSKLIAHNNLEDDEFIVPSCVKDICSYALYDEINDVGARHHKTKSIVFNSNSATINSTAFLSYNCEDVVIPDNHTLKSGALLLQGSPNMDHGYIELGASNYESGSIDWFCLEYIHNMMQMVEDERVYANIKCNFNDPKKINCPFVMNPSNQYDVTNIAILNVPYGTKEKFQNTPGWGNFKKIVENFEYVATKHQLTYMLDGEVYKQVSIEVGAEISAIPSPQKEGYQFSGWIDLPETMGNEDVVVNGRFYMPGDANGDGVVNIADIVEIVNYINKKPSDNFDELAANVYGDDRINEDDIAAILNIIMK